jgi:transcriptional regulator with XRE-family HTH domain
MEKLLKAHKAPSERGRKPLDIDAHVGTRLRTRRILAGMNQRELGRVVRTSFQQVQKYESGTNRISAGHLFLFAPALERMPSAVVEG